MKLVNLIWIIVFILSSCSKSENDQITLYYSIINDKPNPIENNQINLLFPTSDRTQLIIMGGDGNYTVSNLDETVVNVTIESKHINITPLSTGNTTVTITDNSGGLYTLNINILYRKLNFIIDKQDVIVIGDRLSEAQKTDIQQKTILTFPVKVNGGFTFIYDLGEHKGHALVYEDKYDVNGVETTFEEKYTQIESGERYHSFIIDIEGEKREFIVDRYVTLMSKSDMFVPMALIEVLTERFKTEYPNVEWVYTQQRIKQ